MKILAVKLSRNFYWRICVHDQYDKRRSEQFKGLFYSFQAVKIQPTIIFIDEIGMQRHVMHVCAAGAGAICFPNCLAVILVLVFHVFRLVFALACCP